MVWNVVALGDSDTTGEGDASGPGWVGRYARLLRQKLGLDVVVTNLAVGGKTSPELLAEARSDPATRRAIESAQIVLVGIGVRIESLTGQKLGGGRSGDEFGVSALYDADFRATRLA